MMQRALLPGVRQSLASSAPVSLNAMAQRSKHFGQLSKKSKNLNIILTKSVPAIGEEGEALNVKRGYARNFLFPQGIAVYSTPDSQRQYAEAAAKIDYVARARQRAIALAQKRLGKITLKVKRQRVGDNLLHSPVDAKTLSTQLWRQFQIEMPEDKILLEQPGLNVFGSHAVKVRIGETNETVDLSVHVVMR